MTVVLMTVDAVIGFDGPLARVGGLNVFPPDEWNHALTGHLVSNAITFADHHQSPVSVSVDDEWIITVRCQGLHMRKQMRKPADIGPTELEEIVAKLFAFLSTVVDEQREAAPMPAREPFSQCHTHREIPETDYTGHPGHDEQIDCVNDVCRALVDFTLKTGVMPQIEMVEESIAAFAEGFCVRVAQIPDLDDKMNAQHLSMNLVDCLRTLAAEIALADAQFGIRG